MTLLSNTSSGHSSSKTRHLSSMPSHVSSSPSIQQKDHTLFIIMRSPSTPSSGHQHPCPPTRSVSVQVTLLTVLVLLGLVWLLFSTVFHVDSVPGTVGDQTPSPTTAASAALLKRCFKLVAREERHSQTSTWDLDLNYVSKRRVPNGPNPIHNRRAVKYRQPPGA